jgi:hypothetical protein
MSPVHYWKVIHPAVLTQHSQVRAFALPLILLVLHAGISRKYKILIGKPFLMGMVTAMGQIWPLFEDLNQMLIR